MNSGAQFLGYNNTYANGNSNYSNNFSNQNFSFGNENREGLSSFRTPASRAPPPSFFGKKVVRPIRGGGKTKT